jgi:hypothetical protein
MFEAKHFWQRSKALLPQPSFRKSDHSGIVWNCWTGALAHLDVGRATLWNREPRRAQMPMLLALGTRGL